MIFSSSTVCVQPSPKSYSHSHFLCCGKYLDSLTLSSEYILNDVMEPAEIAIAWYDHSPPSYTYALITSGRIASFPVHCESHLQKFGRLLQIHIYTRRMFSIAYSGRFKSHSSFR